MKKYYEGWQVNEKKKTKHYWMNLQLKLTKKISNWTPTTLIQWIFETNKLIKNNYNNRQEQNKNENKK